MFERCKGTTFFETSKSFLKKIFAILLNTKKAVQLLSV